MVTEKSSNLSEELSRDKFRANGCPSFTYTARPCIWVLEFFRTKGRQHLTEKLPESTESSNLSHIEQECQKSLIHGKIHIQQSYLVYILFITGP